MWLTGLPAAGKTTLAQGIADALTQAGRAHRVLDGDVLRARVSADLGFSEADRREQARRVTDLALEAARAGDVVLVALVSPLRDARDAARQAHRSAAIPFIEVHVDTSLAQCEARDPKGLYSRARRGELPGLTGVDAPYEPPLQPELRTGSSGVVANVTSVLELLERGWAVAADSDT